MFDYYQYAVDITNIFLSRAYPFSKGIKYILNKTKSIFKVHDKNPYKILEDHSNILPIMLTSLNLNFIFASLINESICTDVLLILKYI